MDPKKRARIERDAFRIGSVQDMLGLSQTEMLAVKTIVAAVVLLEDNEFALFLQKIEEPAADTTT